jgi:hypothetical protein
VRHRVSITLELSNLCGERWFLTKESGRGPGMCLREEAVGVSRADTGCGKAYAVVKTCATDDAYRRHRDVYFYPLCAGALEGMLKVAQFMREPPVEEGETVGRSFYLSRMRRGLLGGHFCSGRQCACDLATGRKCEACRWTEKRGKDARWYSCPLYKHAAKRRPEFAWFEGVSDAVGDVDRLGGGSRPWLSCSECRA